jgi:segregation and condensation protein A
VNTRRSLHLVDYVFVTMPWHRYLRDVTTGYEIHLPQFEGPFDLLLFFIERDELDIYDIPVSKITDDFLSYLHQMEEMNLDVASEFIVVAATLMRIKAKMLLPRRELDEQGQEVDPRQELVDQLIEYRKYKEAAADFKGLEEERSRKIARGNIESELKDIAGDHSTELEMSSLTLFKLLKAFEKVVTRFEEKELAQHKVIRYPYTIEEMKEYLFSITTHSARVDFEHVFAPCDNRIHAIFIFLALLELVQQGFLTLQVGEGENNFWVSRGEPVLQETTAGN